MDTVSPVANMVIVKALLALDVIDKWNVHQLDISNPFLKGDLTDEVHMSLPLGHKLPFPSTQPLVCKLKRFVYGLKQPSRQWNVKVTEIVTFLGFTKSKAIYTKFTIGKGSSFNVILVYVDDILIAGPSIDNITKFKSDISLHFKLRNLGCFKYFVGIEVAHSK